MQYASNIDIMFRKNKKSGASSPGIIAADWLRLKPYTTAGAYDRAYIQLCQQVFDILSEYKDFFRLMELSRDQRKEMACVLVSQLEDFINEIGIWRAFVSYYTELYDEEFPFGEICELDEYDSEYYNPEDVMLLCWYYISHLSNQRLVAPDHPAIMDITDEVYVLLEAQIDELPATDFYDTYLHIAPGSDFFTLKEKLRWFALGSYVLHPFTRPPLQEDLNEIADKSETSEQLAKFSYAASEKYLYYWRSPYLALSAPEWLARIARDADEPVRQDLLHFYRKVEGLFAIEKTDERHYYMKALSTEQVFPVLKNSLSSKEKTLAPDLLYLMGIKQWNGAWNVSGSVIGLPNLPDVGQAQRQQLPSPYLMTEEQMQVARESTDEIEAAFIKYFGSHYAIFDTAKELHQKVNNFNRNYQKAVAIKHGNDPDDLPSVDFVGDDLPKGLSAAAYFNPGLGIEFYFDVKKLSSWLSSKQPLTLEQAREIWDFLMDEEVSIGFARFFMAQYHRGTPISIIPQSDVDYLQHFDFMMRYFKPNEFGEKLPRMTVLPNP